MSLRVNLCDTLDMTRTVILPIRLSYSQRGTAWGPQPNGFPIAYHIVGKDTALLHDLFVVRAGCAMLLDGTGQARRTPWLITRQ